MRGVIETEETYSYDKSQLPALAAHRGELVVGGELHGKVFAGFAGRRYHGSRDDGLYHGVLRGLEPVTGEDYDTVTHDELIEPGFRAVVLDEETESED